MNDEINPKLEAVLTAGMRRKNDLNERLSDQLESIEAIHGERVAAMVLAVVDATVAVDKALTFFGDIIPMPVMVLATKDIQVTASNLAMATLAMALGEDPLSDKPPPQLEELGGFIRSMCKSEMEVFLATKRDVFAAFKNLGGESQE